MDDTRPLMDTDGTEKIKRILKRRTEAVFPSLEDAVNRLQGKPLKFYMGIDPTGPHVHLGHVVPLLFLKELAGLGHQAVILIGDFTARIGDPTGKDTARKSLTREQVKENEGTYVGQVRKIFGGVGFKVEHNSDWLKGMTLEAVIGLAGRVTVQQMLARDMFQDRIKQERPIFLNEFLYPLMQGYDSVAMEVDGEVGGNDQTFNMLVGRELARELLHKDKLVFATKLLVDTGTGKKMSKTEGGLIAVDDEPREIRRKVLALDDAMIATAFELCTEKDSEWIEQKRKDDPRHFKEELAEELVRMFHGEEAVGETQTAMQGKAGMLAQSVAGTLKITASQAKDLIKQGAVSVNDSAETDWHRELKEGDKVKVGKGKFIEIK